MAKAAADSDQRGQGRGKAGARVTLREGPTNRYYHGSTLSKGLTLGNPALMSPSRRSSRSSACSSKTLWCMYAARREIGL